MPDVVQRHLHGPPRHGIRVRQGPVGGDCDGKPVSISRFAVGKVYPTLTSLSPVISPLLPSPFPLPSPAPSLSPLSNTFLDRSICLYFLVGSSVHCFRYEEFHFHFILFYVIYFFLFSSNRANIYFFSFSFLFETYNSQ